MTYGRVASSAPAASRPAALENWIVFWSASCRFLGCFLYSVTLSNEAFEMSRLIKMVDTMDAVRLKATMRIEPVIGILFKLDEYSREVMEIH